VTLYSYTGGLDGSEVLFYLVDGGGARDSGSDGARRGECGEVRRQEPGHHGRVRDVELLLAAHAGGVPRATGAPRAVADGPLTAVKDGGYALFDVLANDTDPEGMRCAWWG
jgi:hypothetical protein